MSTLKQDAKINIQIPSKVFCLVHHLKFLYFPYLQSLMVVPLWFYNIYFDINSRLNKLLTNILVLYYSATRFTISVALSIWNDVTNCSETTKIAGNDTQATSWNVVGETTSNNISNYLRRSKLLGILNDRRLVNTSTLFG